ncbi:unnamed protein product [[Candida] boidinii]|uniref:Unnamed protein product n=1 Tax=Candida boidinii TaxID=5477 RepID=A0ACB5THY6_CANBO|nr:unnamed protein product [[Candida] boidinii]
MESLDTHKILKVSNLANSIPSKDTSVGAFSKSITSANMNNSIKQKFNAAISRANSEIQNNSSEIFEKKMKQLNITVGSKTKLNLDSSMFTGAIKNYLRLTNDGDIEEFNQHQNIEPFLKNSNGMLNQRTLKNYNGPNNESDELELLAVFSILKICNDFEKNLVDWTSIIEINSKFTTILRIFEFYFLDLKPSDPNFGFKKYNELLISDNTSNSVLIVLLNALDKINNIHLTSLVTSSIDLSTYKLIFEFVFFFHFFNNSLFFFLTTISTNKLFTILASKYFCDDSINTTEKLSASNLSFISVWKRLSQRNSNLSNFISAKDNKISLESFEEFDFFIRKELKQLFSCKNICGLNYTDFINFQNNFNISYKLNYLISKSEIDNSYTDILILGIIHNKIENSNLLVNLDKLIHSTEKLEVIRNADYLLTKLSFEIVSNWGLYFDVISPVKNLILRNQKSYQSILCPMEGKNGNFINEFCFKSLLELIDHNVKLDLKNEGNLLRILKISLFRILTFLDLANSEKDLENNFLRLHDLLVKMGCKYSLSSLIDNVTFILANYLNVALRSNSDFWSAIPDYIENFYGYIRIPPARKSDFMFEDIFIEDRDYQVSSFYNIDNLNYTKNIELVKNCLELSLKLQNKNIIHLRNLKNSSILNFNNNLDLKTDNESFSDISYSKYRSRFFTSLVLFESGNNSKYKFMDKSNKSILFSLISTMILLKNSLATENNSSNNNNDTNNMGTQYRHYLSINFCDELFISLNANLNNLVLLYKEFSTFSIFENFENILFNYDLSLTDIFSQMISCLFIKNNLLFKSDLDLKVEKNVVENSKTLSHLIRQFLELFNNNSREFQKLVEFLKTHPTPIKPSKIQNGNTEIFLNDYIYCISSN